MGFFDEPKPKHHMLIIELTEPQFSEQTEDLRGKLNSNYTIESITPVRVDDKHKLIVILNDPEYI